MDVTFWGVRGSIPSPTSPKDIEQKIADVLVAANGHSFATRDEALHFLQGLEPLERANAGGNTSCVEIQCGDDRLILDAGSGIRGLSSVMMGEAFGRGQGEGHILMSHTHWDHINGFPFFVPVYIPGNRFHIYGCHDHLEQRFRNQHDPRNFPVEFDDLNADLQFHHLAQDAEADIQGFTIRPHKLDHPGDSYAYRIQRNGSTLVYATDGSYNDLSPEAMETYYDFYRGADALIFDAHFDLIESFEKSTWGHSSSLIGVDIAVKSDVKRLILFHHDHVSDDERLKAMFDSTHDYLKHIGRNADCEVVLATEGLALTL